MDTPMYIDTTGHFGLELRATAAEKPTGNRVVVVDPQLIQGARGWTARAGVSVSPIAQGLAKELNRPALPFPSKPQVEARQSEAPALSDCANRSIEQMPMSLPSSIGMGL